MDKLISDVLQWAADRNILADSTDLKQLDKTSEEFNELQRAIAEYNVFAELNDQTSGSFATDVFNSMESVEDAYGDILVTLVIAAELSGTNLHRCLAKAYDVIKDRKGKLINGKFVKEEDL